MLHHRRLLFKRTDLRRRRIQRSDNIHLLFLFLRFRLDSFRIRFVCPAAAALRALTLDFGLERRRRRRRRLSDLVRDRGGGIDAVGFAFP
jgi:hypothetical protein